MLDLKAAMNRPRPALSGLITKRLNPMKWSGSQRKLSVGKPATTVFCNASLS